MHRFVLACLFVLAFLRGFSAEAVIQGSVLEWAGRQGIALFVEDEYTLRPVEAGKFEIDEEGNFEIRLTTDRIRTVTLRCGYINLRLFVKPGKSYSIRLENEIRPMRSMVPSVYTYPVFETLDSEDPNARIGWFNEEYDAFFAENAWLIAQSEYSPGTGFRRSKSENLKEFGLAGDQDTTLLRQEKAFGELALQFTRYIDETSLGWNDPYCRTYCLSVCAELLLSAGVKPDYILGEVLKEYQPDFLNPGYMLFISRSFNSPYGLHLADTLWRVGSWIKSGREAPEFTSYMEGICPGLERTLASQVLFFHVLGLRARGEVNWTDVRSLFSELVNPGGNEELLSLLVRMEEDDKKLAAGRDFPDLLLLKPDQSKLNISDYKGQLLCLAFFTTWNAQSLEELAYLDVLAKKYRREIKMIAVGMDERFEEFRSFATSNPKYSMDFRYGFADFFVREKTGVWSVPHFIILTPEGVILQGQAKQPSRGLEDQIQRSIGIKPEERLKVWDD